eukprot:CAMPEP_0174839090 /NCGR_PEP_ID=MMETSP1114-20130205/7829_1 /TAXON_ID=312471 /ORGANISM="Neobodo designis, Strain CCAP 1951/1" /LENGTH=187 /DNA_ID=CAMNT_0016073211 /DNA_START=485 /DNA_END=1051 /DNA_ORIENTATION=-
MTGGNRDEAPHVDATVRHDDPNGFTQPRHAPPVRTQPDRSVPADPGMRAIGSRDQHRMGLHRSEDATSRDERPPAVARKAQVTGQAQKQSEGTPRRRNHEPKVSKDMTTTTDVDTGDAVSSPKPTLNTGSGAKTELIWSAGGVGASSPPTTARRRGPLSAWREPYAVGTRPIPVYSGHPKGQNEFLA